MTDRDVFPMAELVERTETPRSTIHHYARRGLLPEPWKVASNRFLYDERHVDAVRLIRLLRARRSMSLADIGRVLPELIARGDQEAFHPDMWDQVVGQHLRHAALHAPRTRLLDAAVELFARRGYSHVNVAEICHRARLAKGSFYRHYDSKEQLFLAAAEAAVDEVVAWLDEEDPQIAWREPRGSDADRAVRRLAAKLEPRLSLILELVVGALQRRPGYRATARRLADSLPERLARHLTDSDEPLASAHALVEQALGRVVAGVLGFGPAGSRTLERRGA